MPTVVQLTASIFLGGPERQMLGLAQALPKDYTTVFVSFSEKGRCLPFLEEARQLGFRADCLRYDTPRLIGAARELTALLRELHTDYVCCHGYKADVLGLLSGRRLGIPVIAVSHGWTAQDSKVRLYEKLDRWCLRRMDRVVCVSQKQADKVIAAGTSSERVVVIRDAVRAERFDRPDPQYRARLREFFRFPPACIVGAAGRLSPEKGFNNLVEAAREITQANSSFGFVLFGDGPLRDALRKQICRSELESRFILTGHRTDLDGFLPFLDALVLPSYTEGLPNVVLEAFAAGVPVVATTVGGTPEVVEDGVNGFLVPPGDSGALARRITDLLSCETERCKMGLRGKQCVLENFTFEGQSLLYQRLFAAMSGPQTADLWNLAPKANDNNVDGICHGAAHAAAAPLHQGREL